MCEQRGFDDVIITFLSVFRCFWTEGRRERERSCRKRMANKTEPLALSIHGTNPQNLVEKIVRNRIYNCMYWKEKCFGLNGECVPC